MDVGKLALTTYAMSDQKNMSHSEGSVLDVNSTLKIISLSTINNICNLYNIYDIYVTCAKFKKKFNNWKIKFRKNFLGWNDIFNFKLMVKVGAQVSLIVALHVCLSNRMLNFFLEFKLNNEGNQTLPKWLQELGQKNLGAANINLNFQSFP